MRILSVMALVILAATARGQPTLEIAPNDRIILRSGSWTPTPREADAAYKCVQVFFRGSAQRDRLFATQALEILRHRREYRVQFYGMHRNGRKIIYCNFFPTKSPGCEADPYRDVTTELLEVSDGGSSYWHIDYDPSSKRCSNFIPNGLG